MGLDELIESLSYFVETSNASSPTTSHRSGGTATVNEGPLTVIEEQRPQTMNHGRTPQRSKRELIASMNGTIRRGPGDLELTPNGGSSSSNHSERIGGLSWRNQVNHEVFSIPVEDLGRRIARSSHKSTSI